MTTQALVILIYANNPQYGIYPHLHTIQLLQPTDIHVAHLHVPIASPTCEGCCHVAFPVKDAAMWHAL